MPGSAGQIAPGYNAQLVGAQLVGLEPHATYHFRVAARNSHNQPGQYEAGEELTFTTEGAGGELVLPDNRGFELVSPPDKRGALIEPIQETGIVQAAASGAGITYLTNAPTEAQPAGVDNLSQILSTRGSASWSSRDIALPHAGATGSTFHGQEYRFFNAALTLGAVEPFGEFNPLLSAEASESTSYLRALGDCGAVCFHPLVTGKPAFANVPAGTQFGEEQNCKPKVTGTGATEVFCGPQFLGATEDLSHVVLKPQHVALTGGGPTNGGHPRKHARGQRILSPGLRRLRRCVLVPDRPDHQQQNRAPFGRGSQHRGAEWDAEHGRNRSGGGL